MTNQSLAGFILYLQLLKKKMVKLERLVKQLQDKNVDAFEELHKMYAENICGVINAIVNDEAIAKELCQDVFLKVWQKSELYDSSKGRFFTWLLNMARNKAIDYTRSKRYKTKKKNHSLDLFVNILEKPTEDPNRKEDYEGLKRMLNSLKRKCIDLINAIYFKGCTQADAADLLSIPLGTVKSRNRNCLKELRKNFENE
jgi:RNA polymerase sigma-70 factor (ECF subfamily)